MTLRIHPIPFVRNDGTIPELPVDSDCSRYGPDIRLTFVQPRTRITPIGTTYTYAGTMTSDRSNVAGYGGGVM